MTAPDRMATAGRARTESAAPVTAPEQPGVSTGPDSWIETPTLRRVVAALAIAREMGDVVAIYGAQGVGKTSAALAYTSSVPCSAPDPLPNACVWYVAAHPAIAGVVPLLKAVCDAVAACPTDRAAGAAELHEAAARRVESRKGLLIVDEAQHLTAAALEQLRAIHDASGVGLALIGNRDLYARLVGGKGSTDLDGLRARIGRRLNIDASTPEDAAALADAWGVTSSAGRKLLRDICASAGGLRSAVKALRLADLCAKTEVRPRTDADLRAAWGELGGA